MERSRKDTFWGAVLGDDDVLRGQNRLGQLLVELRDKLTAAADESEFLRVEPPAVADFRLLDKHVSVIEPRIV